MQGDTRLRIAKGEMVRAPKDSMHGAKGVRGKQWSMEPEEAGK